MARTEGDYCHEGTFSNALSQSHQEAWLRNMIKTVLFPEFINKDFYDISEDGQIFGISLIILSI